ncbi:alanine racemase [Eggerthellaceae bacterium zg-887]|uniref:alanine racemase n=1 Tax=Xiamenia xianingshaonis TaxID=2682776 RepID=UPI001408B0D3|nr:alanine racemase [Xiamenia xianingshaonis]NHM16709.1 alanine racemase [Xiamenia xianingshaonis]
MAQQDIPNGFTGFSVKRTAGFQSAKEAMDKREKEARETGGKGAGGMARTSLPVPAFGLIGAEGLQHAEARATSQQQAHALRFAAAGKRQGDARAFDPAKLAEIPTEQRRWSWVEIDLAAIRHNVKEVKRRLPAGTRLMAVVKADGYGHGAVPCAKAALNSGADYLGVATVDEAIELRENYVNAPILVLSQPPETAIPLLLAYKVMPSVYTPDFAISYGEAADAFGVRAPFHLAINTGMNRIGVNHDEVVDFMHAIGFHRALDYVGTFTHFATADHEETLDFQIQYTRFAEAINALRLAGIDPGIVHAANSAAAIRFPDAAFNMVRLGIGLYGLQPSPATRKMIQLKPAMSVHARITDVHFPPIHEGVSYGLHYRSPGNVAICTLPIGYGDGLRRNLSGRIDVLKDGVRFPQVGNVCMDQCMFEIDMRRTSLHRVVEPAIGDRVTIVGRSGDAVVTLDDLANILGTITHELAIGFGTSRLPRLYV